MIRVGGPDGERIGRLESRRRLSPGRCSSGIPGGYEERLTERIHAASQLAERNG